MFACFGRSFEAGRSVIARVCRAKLSCLTSLALVGIVLSGCTVPLRQDVEPSHSKAAHNPSENRSVVDWFSANYRTMAGEALCSFFGCLSPYRQRQYFI